MDSQEHEAELQFDFERTQRPSQERSGDQSGMRMNAKICSIVHDEYPTISTAELVLVRAAAVGGPKESGLPAAGGQLERRLVEAAAAAAVREPKLRCRTDVAST